MARRNIALFEPLLGEVEAIVTDCAGCSAGLKEYAEWLHDDPAWAGRAQAFSAKVRDVTEWLDAVWPEDLPLRHAPVPATYHDPCHAVRGQSLVREPRDVLRRHRQAEAAVKGHARQEVVEERQTGVHADLTGSREVEADRDVGLLRFPRGLDTPGVRCAHGVPRFLYRPTDR